MSLVRNAIADALGVQPEQIEDVWFSPEGLDEIGVEIYEDVGMGFTQYKTITSRPILDVLLRQALGPPKGE